MGWLFEDIQGLEDGDMISLDILPVVPHKAVAEVSE